jgi:murein DD-endopeptidase MepM/ murein hydrolase activator NlpD
LSAHHRKSSIALTRRKHNSDPKSANLQHSTIIAQGRRARRESNLVYGRPTELSNTTISRNLVDVDRNAKTIFYWPAPGKVIVRFGARRNAEKSRGISIAVPEDTPIRCADDGVVIYAGSGLKTFGNLVLVRHSHDYVTTYAHAKELTVKRGDQVKRGDILGSSGRTGDVSTPQVYFEIRKNSTPVDPLRLLEDHSRREAGSRHPRLIVSAKSATEAQLWLGVMLFAPFAFGGTDYPNVVTVSLLSREFS